MVEVVTPLCEVPAIVKVIYALQYSWPDPWVFSIVENSCEVVLVLEPKRPPPEEVKYCFAWDRAFVDKWLDPPHPMPHIVLRQQAFVDHIFWHHLLPFLINVAIEWVFLSCRWFLKAYSHQVGTKYHISWVASHDSFLSVHELPYMALYNLTFHLAYVLFIELRILLFRSFTEGCHDAFRVQLSLLDAPHKSHNHSCGIDAARPEQIDLSPIEFIK